MSMRIYDARVAFGNQMHGNVLGEVRKFYAPP